MEAYGKSDEHIGSMEAYINILDNSISAVRKLAYVKLSDEHISAVCMATHINILDNSISAVWKLT
jgi:hypothetical protein